MDAIERMIKQELVLQDYSNRDKLVALTEKIFGTNNAEELKKTLRRIPAVVRKVLLPAVIKQQETWLGNEAARVTCVREARAKEHQFNKSRHLALQQEAADRKAREEDMAWREHLGTKPLVTKVSQVPFKPVTLREKGRPKHLVKAWQQESLEYLLTQGFEVTQPVNNNGVH